MRYIPIFIASIGIIIHILGLCNFIPNSGFGLDFLMLMIDFLVVYGLIKRKIWGYWLAVVLYTQQSFMQPYWAYQKYLSHFYIVHSIEYFVPSLLVIFSLMIMIFYKKEFYDSN